MSGLDTIKLVPLAELVPHPRNVRTWDVRELMTMIVETGWHGVVIQQASSGFLLAGHGRREAVLALNALVEEHEDGDAHAEKPEPLCPRCRETPDDFPMLALPTDVQDVSDEDAVRKVVGDNRAGELSSWHQPALASLLTFLQETPRGLVGTGHTDSHLSDLLSKLNTKPPTLEELAKQNVDPDDFTRRIIKLSVQPAIFTRWESILAAHESAEHAFVALLDRR